MPHTLGTVYVQTPSLFSHPFRTPAPGGDQTPVDIGDQTPGLLITTDPFDTVVAEIEPPLAAQPEVTEVKPRLYTSVAHVMARHPNELSLQLSETVEVSLGDAYVRTYVCAYVLCVHIRYMTRKT